MADMLALPVVTTFIHVPEQFLRILAHPYKLGFMPFISLSLK